MTIRVLESSVKNYLSNAIGGSSGWVCLAKRDGSKRVEGAQTFGGVGRAGYAGEDATVAYAGHAE